MPCPLTTWCLTELIWKCMRISQVSFWGKRDWQMASTVGLWLLRGKCTKVTLPLAAPSQWLRRKDTTMAGSFLWHTLPLWLGTLAWEKLSPHPNQSHQTVLRLHYNLRSSVLFLFFFFCRGRSTLEADIPHPLWLPPQFSSQTFLLVISSTSIHLDIFFEDLDKLLPHVWIIEVFSFLTIWLKLNECVQE